MYIVRPRARSLVEPHPGLTFLTAAMIATKYQSHTALHVYVMVTLHCLDAYKHYMRKQVISSETTINVPLLSSTPIRTS